MSRYHRCDPRADYICPACEQRHLDEERELDKCDGSLECPARLHIIGCESDDWRARPDLYLVGPDRPQEPSA